MHNSWGVFYLSDTHDDVIKWKRFPHYWPYMRGIPRSPVNSPHKGQWRGALMFSLICAWTNGWITDWDAGDARRHRAHFDVTVMGNDINQWNSQWHPPTLYACGRFYRKEWPFAIHSTWLEFLDILTYSEKEHETFGGTCKTEGNFIYFFIFTCLLTL